MDIAEIKHMEVSVAEPSAELKEAYDNLKLLARTPVKREMDFEDCQCDPRFKNEYEYRSIECKVCTYLIRQTNQKTHAFVQLTYALFMLFIYYTIHCKSTRFHPKKYQNKDN